MDAINQLKTADPQRDFADFTEQITSLISRNDTVQLENTITGYTDSSNNQAHQLLLQGVMQFFKNQHIETVRLMNQARELLKEDEYPDLSSIYTQVYIKAQLSLTRRERPSNVAAYGYYRKNIESLRRMDPVLVDQVQSARWPGEYAILDFWSGLHLFDTDQNVLFTMQEDLKQILAPALSRRDPITFGGICFGQEIRYCLHRQVKMLHGMTRPHYLFETHPEKIKMLLYMDDFSGVLTTEELLIFGGSNMEDRVRRIFDTFRYVAPGVIVGDQNLVQPFVKQIQDHFTDTVSIAAVEDYYRSDEYRQRRRQLAAGEITPRILVDTCRWTTYLKYCAADFEKSFSRHGCATRYLIEDNDVQTTTTAMHWQVLQDFKPDIVFMVSHGRSSLPYFPEPVSFISFIQDKCGPLEAAADLTDAIQPHDLLVCATDNYREWLMGKSATAAQTSVMPVPADDTIFFPLDESTDQKYVAAVGFVKHGGPEFEKVFTDFIAKLPVPNSSDSSRGALPDVVRNGFVELYNQFCFSDLDQTSYDDEMTEFLLKRIQPTNEQARHQLERLIWMFYCQVYSNAWRYHFLEKLDEAGIQLVLYGNNWDQHARLKHLGRGPVEHGSDLNQVYNFNQISLSINHFVTMNQRISECALAGGFVMAASHPTGKDGIDARNYLRENEEVVFFDTAADLIDKCRYYLDHPEERKRIAENARRRAQAGLTVDATARQMLQQWRKLL